MRPESSKRFQVNEISFPASGYEPEGREFESLRAHHSYTTVRLSHLSQRARKMGHPADCIIRVNECASTVSGKWLHGYTPKAHLRLPARNVGYNPAARAWTAG